MTLSGGKPGRNFAAQQAADFIPTNPIYVSEFPWLEQRMQFNRVRRREFITLLGGAAVAWPLAALGQQPGKLPLIGVLVSASPPHPFADAFWRGLHALGYSEGQNIKVEFRYTEGRSD